LTQAPSQTSFGAVHSDAGLQAPETQASPLGQTVPQSPQLSLSAYVLTHVPLQSLPLMQRHWADMQ
jgi:hypothetical protein